MYSKCLAEGGEDEVGVIVQRSYDACFGKLGAVARARVKLAWGSCQRWHDMA